MGSSPQASWRMTSSLTDFLHSRPALLPPTPTLFSCRALIRSKMTTDEGKVETDKARDAFQRRLAAAQAVGQPGEIDWAHYKAKLPDLNVDALKKDYEAFVAAIPAQTYDETADKAAHGQLPGMPCSTQRRRL